MPDLPRQFSLCAPVYVERNENTFTLNGYYIYPCSCFHFIVDKMLRNKTKNCPRRFDRGGLCKWVGGVVVSSSLCFMYSKLLQNVANLFLYSPMFRHLGKPYRRYLLCSPFPAQTPHYSLPAPPGKKEDKLKKKIDRKKVNYNAKKKTKNHCTVASICSRYFERSLHT